MALIPLRAAAADVATPPANYDAIFVDSTTGLLCRKDEDGTVLVGDEMPFTVAVSDETTALAASAPAVTVRVPWPCRTSVLPRGSLSTASTAGAVEFGIKKNGVSILSTTLTIDQDETTSTTATTPAVLAADPTTFANDDEVRIDIVDGGTGAAGGKITLYLQRIAP